MLGLLSALVAGGLFALGLCTARMTDPNAILQFLDITGDWNPALALVMIGAIGTYLPLYWLISRREKPLAARRFSLPEKTKIDWRLVVGAAVFGIGWGLSGFCPGPALASLATFKREILVFVAAMIAGMSVAEKGARAD